MSRAENPLTIAVLGRARAGKTLLLNALLRQEIIPEASKHPHLLRFGREAESRIHTQDGRQERLPLSKLRALASRRDLRLVEILLPLEELLFARFLDLPSPPLDLGAQSLLDRADALLWLVGADQPERSWQEVAHSGQPTLAIVSRQDRVPEGALSLVREQAKRRLEGRALMVLSLSARLALDALQQRDAGLLKLSGLTELRAAMEANFFRRAEHLRAQSLRRQAEGLRGQALQALEGWRETLQKGVRGLEHLLLRLKQEDLGSWGPRGERRLEALSEALVKQLEQLLKETQEGARLSLLRPYLRSLSQLSMLHTEPPFGAPLLEGISELLQAIRASLFLALLELEERLSAPLKRLGFKP